MKTSIIVQNLRCNGCVNTITTKLSTLKNISDLQIDKDESKVSFACQSEEDVKTVKDKLSDLGYPSVDDNNSMMTKAKSIVSCATGKLK